MFQGVGLVHLLASVDFRALFREGMALYCQVLPSHPSSCGRITTPIPSNSFFSETYLGFEGNELQDHFHREEASEKHVEYIHGNFEEAALAVMLSGGREGEDHEHEAEVLWLFITFVQLSHVYMSSPHVYRGSSLSHPQKAAHHALGRQVDSEDTASSCLSSHL